MMRLIALAFLSLSAAQAQEPARFTYEIVRVYPHDPEAFTQGLLFHGGALFESTGLYGRSTLREVELETGAVRRSQDFPAQIFAEGIALDGEKIIALTWRNRGGYVFKREDFSPVSTFDYEGEGWGLASDGARLIMSDGTADLRFLDPVTLVETGRVTATLRGKPLKNLNELEWIDGALFANVWRTNVIVRIDIETGAVTGLIDLRGLRDALGDAPQADVLNGIAWDADAKRLFVTGKNWPKLFEIRLVEQTAK